MKFIKQILFLSLLLWIVLPARAQFDFYGAPRTVEVITPQFISASASNGFVVDLHGFQGIAKLDILSPTNLAATNRIVFNITTSPDLTNFSQVSYAQGVSQTIIYTNNYYGTATPLATNVYLKPGTVTTPTAATAGFATAYLGAPGNFYTNTAPLTNIGNPFSLGFNVQDIQRYLMIQVTVAGTTTNPISAVLTARKQQE